MPRLAGFDDIWLYRGPFAKGKGLKPKKKKARIYGASDVTVYDASGKVKQIIPLAEAKEISIGIKQTRKAKKKAVNKAIAKPSDTGRESKAYNQWRHVILKRDKFKCVLCGSKTRIEAHHIVRWADNKKLRFDTFNGVALCYDCHQLGHAYNKKPFPAKTTSQLRIYINHLQHKKDKDQKQPAEYIPPFKPKVVLRKIPVVPVRVEQAKPCPEEMQDIPVSAQQALLLS